MAGTTKAQIKAYNASKGTSTSKTSSSGSTAQRLAQVSAQAKSLGIDTSKADSMLAQTKAQGSTPYKGSSFEKTYLASTPVITPSSLAKKEVPTIPPPPAPVNPGSIVQTNSALGAGLADFGYTVDQNGQFVQKATGTSPADQLFEWYQKTLPQAPDTLAIRQQLEKQSGLKQKQADVNNYTAQLNAITASSQAEQLKLEGQGRGQTSGFIGGEQARINREAAIQALPVQAQLAAAQGNLEMAQQHVDKMFSIMSQDALAQYQYKTKVVDSFFQFANAQQQRQLDQLNIQESRKYDMYKSNVAYARELANTAMNFGQAGLATRFGQLDFNSPTFSSDIAKLQSQLSRPVDTTASVPTVKTINGVDMQWNPSTGKWDSIDTGMGGTSLKPVAAKEITDLSETWTAKNSVVELVDKLQNNIRQNGTQILWGKAAGERSGATTNLLLAMKNLEKTGALDKGTIDVLQGTIPSSKFFATEKAQIAALEEIKSTIVSKVDEYVGSYRGTTAETDPRTQRIYSANLQLLDPTDLQQIDAMFGTSSTTQFNPASYF